RRQVQPKVPSTGRSWDATEWLRRNQTWRSRSIPTCLVGRPWSGLCQRPDLRTDGIPACGWHRVRRYERFYPGPKYRLAHRAPTSHGFAPARCGSAITDENQPVLQRRCPACLLLDGRVQNSTRRSYTIQIPVLGLRRFPSPCRQKYRRHALARAPADGERHDDDGAQRWSHRRFLPRACELRIPPAIALLVLRALY